jgi:hypothetical protein
VNIKVTCDPVTNIYQLVYVDNSLGLTVGKPYDHLSMWFDYCAVTSRPTRSGEDEDFNDRRPRALSCGYKLSPPPLRIQLFFAIRRHRFASCLLRATTVSASTNRFDRLVYQLGQVRSQLQRCR